MTNPVAAEKARRQKRCEEIEYEGYKQKSLWVSDGRFDRLPNGRVVFTKTEDIEDAAHSVLQQMSRKTLKRVVSEYVFRFHLSHACGPWTYSRAKGILIAPNEDAALEELRLICKDTYKCDCDYRMFTKDLKNWQRKRLNMPIHETEFANATNDCWEDDDGDDEDERGGGGERGAGEDANFAEWLQLTAPKPDYFDTSDSEGSMKRPPYPCDIYQLDPNGQFVDVAMGIDTG